MKTRRWPDVVIIVALVAVGATGVWVLFGEDLGLRKADRTDEPAPTRAGPGGSTS